MNKVLKILLIILLIGLCATAVGFAVKGSDDGNSSSNSTTNDDLQDAYDRGYNDAGMDKNRLNELITKNGQLESNINLLTSEKNALTNDVASLTQQRDELLSQNESLQQTVTDKDNFIKELSAEKLELIQQNNETINGLNAQIADKQNQIASLNTQIASNAMTVQELNETIASLQATITEYQDYLATIDNPNNARVTFYFGGAVYSIKSVPKGSKVTIDDPQSTDLLVFNGWTIDGVAVDLSTYTVTGNVDIVADATRYHVVTFMVNGVVSSTQRIIDGQYITDIPTPKRTNYTFDYWTTDGNTQVYFDRLPISSDITLYAKFTRLYWAEFVFADGTPVINKKRVNEGSTTAVPTVPSSYGRFNGWRVDGELVDAVSYKFYKDTVFVADITPIYTVKFIETVQNTIVKTETVYAGNFATAPDTFATSGSFMGWIVDGVVVDVATYAINANTTFTAKFGTLRQLEIDEMDLMILNDAEPMAKDKSHVDIRINGLKAGDKVALDVQYLSAFIDTGDENWFYNALDGNTCKYWYVNGDTPAWVYVSEMGSVDRKGTTFLNSLQPLVTTLGVYLDHYNTPENTFTITVSCTQDNVLTISWDDNAGFYLYEHFGITAVYVWE